MKTGWLWLAALLAGAFTAGCIVIPHPRDIATAHGLTAKKPKLAFLKSPALRRQDVMQVLGHFKTEASEGLFFWARWQQVKVQVEWAAGAGYSAGAGSERIWKTVNVLAVFDENDRLMKHQICSDGELTDSLRSFHETIPGAPATASLVVPAEHGGRMHRGKGRAILEEGHLNFEEWKTRRHNFSVPLSAVTGLVVEGGSTAEFLRMRFRFLPGTAPYETLHVTLSPREIWQLLGMVRSVPERRSP